jgi:hypothetical protein
VDFSEFMNAVKQLGISWAAVNEPRPDIGSEETSVQNDEVISPGKKEGKNENYTPHPASGE